MNRNIAILLGYFLLCACSGTRKKSKVNIILNEIGHSVYDSVQTFVDINIQSNLHSEVYLLSYVNINKDSINYLLTSLPINHVPNCYRYDPYVFNKDSSILIIDDDNGIIRNGLEAEKNISKLKNVQFSMKSGDVIFDPIIWEITIVSDSLIIIDRGYGLKQAEKSIVVPKEKFKAK